jgi:hypothetical protein
MEAELLVSMSNAFIHTLRDCLRHMGRFFSILVLYHGLSLYGTNVNSHNLGALYLRKERA